MESAHAVPPLLSILVGLVFSAVAWGLVRVRNRETDDMPMGRRDNLLLGLMVLAAFILGACLTYFLLTSGL